MHLGGFSPRLFNVDELPKRTAVCCITQVKSTSSKVRIPICGFSSVLEPCGLAEETMDYLEAYRYGADLLQKLAAAN